MNFRYKGKMIDDVVLKGIDRSVLERGGVNMHMVIIQCFDCNGATFAIEAERNEWKQVEAYDDFISEFSCPYCENQIWEKQSMTVGIIQIEEDGPGRNITKI